MISFSNPALLWAFSAMAIPLAIHLLSRKEGVIVYMGSLRHLKESNTKQSISVRLNEWWLLLLRMLMVLFLVLLMAGMHWPSSSPVLKWLLVEKGLERNAQLAKAIDSLQNQKYELRIFAPGFPRMEDSTSVTEIFSYQDLLSSLERLHIDDAVVFSYSQANKFKGSRMKLPSGITWIPVESNRSQFAVSAVRLSPDSIQLRSGSSNAVSTTFESSRVVHQENVYVIPSDPVSSINIRKADTVSFLLVSDRDFSLDRKVIQACLDAIRKSVPDKLRVAEAADFDSGVKADWLIWLSIKPAPENVFENILEFHEDSFMPLVYKRAPSHWRITSRINEEVALKSNLALELTRIIFPGQDEANISSHDRRSLDERMAWSKEKVDDNSEKEASIANGEVPLYLLLLLALTLLSERVLAFKRNQ